MATESQAPVSSSSTQRSVEITLDGYNLTIEKLVLFGRGQAKLSLSPEAWDRIDDARDFLLSETAKRPVYGVNTGFGSLSEVRVSHDDLKELQINLVRSTACGLGEPIPLDCVRMMFALRINVLAKGFSGIRRETLTRLVSAFNADCLPKIPEQGTVGASGDLSPLSHLALGIMGEGDMWHHPSKSWRPALDVLKENGCTPIELEAKEGLALINGTQFITSITTLALDHAKKLLDSAIGIAGLSMLALSAGKQFLDPRIHAARGQTGQTIVANTLRAIIESVENVPEEKTKDVDGSHEKSWTMLWGGSPPHNSTKVQDAYTLRCIPQVYGMVFDTLKFVEGIISREVNSGTDNPMIFADDKGTSAVLSGGNFHAEYPAKAADILAIGISDLGTMSERRIYRMTTTHLSGLPPFLLPKGNAGLHCGFMIPQYTAAAITSENKVLVHPASCDSIPTCAGQEDHVSMGGFAARKALQLVTNVEKIIAIELFTACQAVEFLEPKKKLALLASPMGAVFAHVRKHIPLAAKDRYFSPEMEWCFQQIHSGVIADLMPFKAS